MKDYTIISKMTTEEFAQMLDDMKQHYWKVIPKTNKYADKYGERTPFELKWTPKALKR